ncbi:aspartyl protease family protein [Thalassotalea sp. ND16A]|uniref:aspartyl protease family protein n=1 Tax=Thalassotalea sp. ND16A TaxID=1535422 RepID=UPI00051A098B|nr:aspartyl protease family protein [Thalassotalea sp. ND16A]KGK01648.1 hypothetical protein ND16A_2932 [Thalassotalea sp. ND16A]
MNTLKSTFLLIITLYSQHALAEWVPFELVNNHITINIKVAGQPVKAILDSGANINLINQQFVDQFGEDFTRTGKVTTTGVNGKRDLPLYSRIPIEMFNASFTIDKVASGYLGDITFLFGSSFFKNFIVQIDYPKSMIQLLPKKAIDLRKFANVDMRKERGSDLPAIQVLANGKKIWLTFDTGNNSGIFLKRSVAISNNFIGDKKVEQTAVQGINKKSSTESFFIDTLKIGPYELENIPVTIPAEGVAVNIGRTKNSTPTGSSIKQGVKTKGIIGYDVLRHFLVTIDYTNYRAHIIAQ